MNENKTINKNIPEADITEGKRISIIWIFPIIAAIIGLWLIYQSYLERGVPITILFESGEGIVKKETLIKYDGVAIGVVDSVELSPDKKNVIVNATLDKSAEDLAKEGAKFWVVRPRFNVGGVSGLDTIISGEYITIRPGKGKYKNSFIGLNHPPLGDPDAPGLHLVLYSDRLGSLSEGSPILFREIEVGQVYGHKLSKDEKSVQIHVLIYKNYVPLVKKNSKFWNASGVSITGAISSGFKVETGSLASVLTGGIAFETPETNAEAPICINGDCFKLYSNKESAMEGGFLVKIRFQSGDGIIPGSTMVKYKGLNVGKVTKIEIGEDLQGVIVSTIIKEAAKTIAAKGSQFWVVKPRFSLEGVSGISTLVSGQYIEVRPGQGEPAFSFTGLEKPPLGDLNGTGLHILLKADHLGSLSEGAPVYFKKIKVGEIHGHELSPNDEQVFIHAYIYEKYVHLVKETTRFWNVSGFNVSAGLSGVKINTHSLSALIDGGVAFETPDSAADCKPCKNGEVFKLYDDYESAMEGGIPLTITFKSANGLKNEQTLIKFQGLIVGKVKSVEFNPKMDRVIVHALLNQSAEDLAVEGSLFWVERPKFTMDGVSGLNTLLSGEYIEVHRGKGAPSQNFVGLEEPPIGDMLSAGLHIVLQSETLGAFKIGNPVLYKDFNVGKIEGFEIAPKADKINIHIFIYEKYAHFVKKESKFWKAGGVQVEAGLSGIKVTSKPLAALISGAIAFETPQPILTEKDSCKNGTLFQLHENYETAMAQEIPVTLTFSSGSGLTENGTLLKYMGTPVGKVKKIRLNENLDGVTVEACIYQNYSKLMESNCSFNVVRPQIGLSGISGLDTLITGPYIEVIPELTVAETADKKANRKNSQETNATLKITLFSKRLGSLSKGAPVYYRQVKVGEVINYGLSKNSNKIRLDLHIEKKYAPLVRKNSKFWNASGVDVSIKPMSISIQTESMLSLLSGGISFATPDNSKMGDQAENNETFKLYEKPKSKWLIWQPQIKLGE